jgi:hypothetical protein
MLNRVRGSTCQGLRSTSARGAGRSLGATSPRGRTRCPHAPAADAGRSCGYGTGGGAETRPAATYRRAHPRATSRHVHGHSTPSRGRRRAASAGSVPPQDRRLPLPRQILKGAGLEQRLVELTPLKVAQLHEWWVADDLLDAAAQLGGRHSRWPCRPFPSYVAVGGSESGSRASASSGRLTGSFAHNLQIDDP